MKDELTEQNRLIMEAGKKGAAGKGPILGKYISSGSS
jgi:hypothetical protein